MKNWKNCFGYVFVALVFYGVVKWLFMGGLLYLSYFVGTSNRYCKWLEVVNYYQQKICKNL